MPSKERNAQLCRNLLNAAIDQYKPSPALVAAAQALLTANDHAARRLPVVVAPSCTCLNDPLSPLQLGSNLDCPIHGAGEWPR